MNDIQEQIKEVNDVFAQVGYVFGIHSTTNVLSDGEYWNMTVYETKQISSSVGEVEFEEETEQFLEFVKTFNAANILELYYIGDLSFYRNESGSGRIAMVKAGGVYINRMLTSPTNVSGGGSFPMPYRLSIGIENVTRLEASCLISCFQRN